MRQPAGGFASLRGLNSSLSEVRVIGRIFFGWSPLMSGLRPKTAAYYANLSRREADLVAFRGRSATQRDV